MTEAETVAREEAGWGTEGKFDLDRPLQVMTGARPAQCVALWKGRAVPYLRKVVWRWDGVPEVVMAQPNANAHLGVTSVSSEQAETLRRQRDLIAKDMRADGISVVIQ